MSLIIKCKTKSNKKIIFNNWTDLNKCKEKIVKLSCKNNNLKYIPPLPTSLKKLNISNNNLNYLPSNILKLKKLKKIKYSNNNLDLNLEEINFLLELMSDNY